MATQADGKIVAAGSSDNGSNEDFAWWATSGSLRAKGGGENYSITAFTASAARRGDVRIHFLPPWVRGAPLIQLLRPDHGSDFYILKPQHSGFFRTGLEVLLERLGVSTLILTGIAGDICVLFTANDAYMRGFNVIVPSDCIVSEGAEDNEHALRQMERLLKAVVKPSEALELSEFSVPPRSAKQHA